MKTDFTKLGHSLAAWTLNRKYDWPLANIAGLLGVSRSTVSRMLAGLEADGYAGDFETHIKSFADIADYPFAKTQHLPGKVVSVEGETTGVVVAFDSSESFPYQVVAVELDSELYAYTKAQIRVVKTKRSRKAVLLPTVAAPVEKPKRVRKAKAKVLKVKEGDEAKCLVTPTSVVVVRNGIPQVIDKKHQNFELIAKAVQDQNYERAYELIDIRQSFTKWSQGRVVVDSKTVRLDGKPIHPKLQNAMLQLLMNGETEALSSWSLFLEKCAANPSFRVLTRLYDFMQARDITIDKDGHVLAWKIVRSDYKDKHTGTFDNSPGTTVEMPRNECNDNDDQTCSNGLHVCSKSYFGHFASSRGAGGRDRVVQVSVNPADWVSVPIDYNDAKARVCKYVVLKDVSDQFWK